MKPNYKNIIMGIVLFLAGTLLLSPHPAQVYPVKYEIFNGARRVRGDSVVLSTGLRVSKVSSPVSFVNPFLKYINDAVVQVKWRGRTDAVVKDIIEISERCLKDEYGISLPPIVGNIIPFSELRKMPAFHNAYSFMTTFYNHTEKHIQIMIDEELLSKCSDREFVQGVMHEVISFGLFPLHFFRLHEEDPEGLFYATEAGGYKLIPEGFADFLTNGPFTLKQAKEYANALRDGCFPYLFPNLDKGEIDMLRRNRWYNNAHPLGLLMFDVFSRVNPEAMLEYAKTFFNRLLGENATLVDIGSLNAKEIIYQDYVKLCGLVGEEPYPRYVFFESEK